MDVNKNNLIFLFLFFWIDTIYANEVPLQNNVNLYVEKKLKQALVEWGDKVKVCLHKEEQNSLYFQPTELEDLNITLHEFRTAIMTLNYNNYTQCTKEEKNAFIFQSLLVYKIQQQNEDGTDALNFLLETLPSDEVLNAFEKFEKLPLKIKSYFEKHIGTEPFNIVKVSMPILKYFKK